jgi:hypothetical protein
MYLNASLSIGGAFVALLALLSGPVMATSEISSIADSLERLGVKPKRELVVEAISGDSFRGTFMRFNENSTLIMRRYVSSDDRFRPESIPLSTLKEVRLLQKRSTAKYIFLGALIGGSCAATVGYVAGSRNSGDVGPSDTRLIYAAGGLLLGSVAGLFTGAIATPSRSVETVIWSR